MNYRYNSEVLIPLKDVTLKGDLVIPTNSHAIVIFSHGSGSSRKSPRNQMVARKLHTHHFGTLLFDLLTPREDQDYSTRFDIDLLTKRLSGVTEWLESQPASRKCRIGYFGASTGAASALRAASYHNEIGAVVSRGGRPDLAMDILELVQAPTLLIVGGNDHDVLLLNKAAYERMQAVRKIEIIENASHLFEEYGAMDKVVNLAISWFEEYLVPVAKSRNLIH